MDAVIAPALAFESFDARRGKSGPGEESTPELRLDSSHDAQNIDRTKNKIIAFFEFARIKEITPSNIIKTFRLLTLALHVACSAVVFDDFFY
jgi:hypothetical protein